MAALDQAGARPVQLLLVDAEQRAADVPQLQLRIEELEQRLTDAQREINTAHAQIRDQEEQLMRASQALVDVLKSPSWRITKPLRRAKQFLP